MTYDVNQDNAALLADLGVIVDRTGNPDFTALFEQAGTEAIDGTGQTVKLTETAIRYPASLSPPLTDNEVVVIGGVTYYVRDRDPVDDGNWMRATLTR